MRLAPFTLVPFLALVSAQRGAAQSSHDSALHAMQARGHKAMGVDQYRSRHRFTSLPTGGTIQLASDSADAEATAAIRTHFAAIAKAFAAGDFSIPGFVHAREVPGTAVMKARATRITYTVRDVTRGAELSIVTGDRRALSAIHEFLAFQRAEHHAEPTRP
jgi:hypothetical protein